MNLLFKADEITSRGRGLTFDDVLLVPRHSEIASRSIPTLKTQLTKNFQIDMPLISANMDTVTGADMVCAMAELGGVGILHRFMTTEEQVLEVEKIKAYFTEKNITLPIAASIGVKEKGKERADALAKAGAQIFTIDIAHGDSVMMLDTLSYVKEKYPRIDVIAGNVATPDGVRRMIERGADAVKVGIGPGSMCTTRIITGHGVPQLSAIAMCVEEASKSNVPVIADGGIKNSGDIVKCLAAGAQSVMLGSLLAGTLETPGELKAGQKEYRGMASKAAQISWRGDLPKGMAAEGVDTMIPCKGPVSNILMELLGGLRSGMTYLGVSEIPQMENNSLFIEISASGMAESRPHGLKG